MVKVDQSLGVLVNAQCSHLLPEVTNLRRIVLEGFSLERQFATTLLIG